MGMTTRCDGPCRPEVPVRKAPVLRRGAILCVFGGAALSWACSGSDGEGGNETENDDTAAMGDTPAAMTPETSPEPMGPAPCTDTLDNLEDSASHVKWQVSNDASDAPAPTLEFTALGGSQAVRTTGSGFVDWGAGLGFDMVESECLDFASSTGIRFRVRSTGNFRVAVQTTAVLPAESGGSCVPMGVQGCFDTHAIAQTSASDFQQRVVYWSDLAQAGWGVPAAFDPADIVSVVFSFGPNQMPFDLAVDDLELLTTPGGAPPTPPPDPDPDPPDPPVVVEDSPLGMLLSEQSFNSMFPNRNSFYTYQGLLQAAQRFPLFAGDGTDEVRLREVAAFLGNVAHETGHLEHINEISPQGNYCDNGSAQYPCAPGASYHGRGPIQLSWNYNYGSAGSYLGEDLLANPNLVANDASIAWATALWFWMTSGSNGNTPHRAMVDGDGFGATIRIINGGLECDGAGPSAVQQRVQYFQNFANILGVSPGGNLSC